MDWMQLFRGHILDRGYEYFCDDAVEDMVVSEDVITATVCGSDDYEVEINFCGDKIADMYCSCPYAGDGNRCKHMAAVLYEWEADKKLANVEREEDILQRAVDVKTTDEVEELIKRADEKQIRDFLSYVLHNDEKLFSRFKTLLQKEISKPDMERYKRQVDATIDKYLGRENFISYYNAYGFILEMETYLNEDVRMMLDSGCYWSAFELTCYMFIAVGNIDMDDSDGGTSMFADQCLEIWEEILDCADKETEEKIYKWFTEHLNGSVIDYMEDYIETILMERFVDERYLQEKLAYIEKKVSEAKKLSDSWSSGYKVAKWALQYINLMEDMGNSQEDIFEYCKENWKYSEIRKYYISKCMERKDYAAAITVLQESLELDAGMRGLVAAHSSKLKEIYRLLGNAEAYKQQLWSLVTKDDVGNLEHYKELKLLYGEEEWKTVREKIFAMLPKNTSIAHIYKEEKLYDRLLAYVLSSYGIYELKEYEKELKEYYPAEILQKYADELNKMAAHTADRKRYQEWVAILRRMLKIKGGKEKVREITEHWQVIYRNRPAMMDELRRL